MLEDEAIGPGAGAELVLGRSARIFSGRPGLSGGLGRDAEVVALAGGQIHHPAVGREVVVRLGRLRVSEFLPDGREVCRAVLQAGSYLVTRAAGDDASRSGRTAYPLERMLVMALGRTELWVLPPGTLGRHDV